MALDEKHVALPKLYGAPAYARPPAPVPATPRPLDPDDLPIVAFQTDDERELLEALPSHGYAPNGGAYIEAGSRNGSGSATSGPSGGFTLRAIAGRLLGG